jgi:hypothetical protein
MLSLCTSNSFLEELSSALKKPTPKGHPFILRRVTGHLTIHTISTEFAHVEGTFRTSALNDTQNGRKPTRFLWEMRSRNRPRSGDRLHFEKRKACVRTMLCKRNTAAGANQDKL